MAQQVATHKLFAPAASPGAIHRKHVLDRIIGEYTARVVLLQAPAGHGKSTVLQQAKRACETRGEVTGWLTFDEADNDVTRLLAHFQALANVVTQQTGEGSVAHGESIDYSSNALRPDWFINALLETRQQVALFFDEFQSLTDASVLGFIQKLLEQAPDNIRLFLGSRALPDLNLSRLTVNKRIQNLRPEDLCFSRRETTEFFAQADELELTTDEIETVHERSEGWPAALQLYRLALVAPEVRAALCGPAPFQPRQLAEYLADNVLSLQTEQMQTFLLHTAPLIRLSANLCNSVLERKDCQTMLQNMESSGLFVRTLDPEGCWFKYHSLFASFLVEQLQQQQPDTLNRIHGRAARWFQDHELPEEALYHATACEDFPLAATILDQWATSLTANGNLMTVERWYGHLPDTEIEQHPDLLVKVAYALIFLRRHEKLPPVLAMLAQLSGDARARMHTSADVVRSMAAIIAYDDQAQAAKVVAPVSIDDDSARGFRAFELAAAANLKGYLALAKGEFEAAREALSLGRTHSDLAGATFSRGYATGTAGMNLLAQGRSREALDLLAEGMTQTSRSLDDSLDPAAVVSCYICALYEINALDEATEQFQQFYGVIVDAAALDYLSVAFIPMARIHSARGRTVEAAETLDRAERIARISQWPRLVRAIGWERAHQAILANDLAGARAIREQLNSQSASMLAPEWLPFSEDANGDLIGETRLAIHDGRPAEALKWIASELSSHVSRGRVRRRVKLRILEALAHSAAGDNTLAHRSLRRALTRAVPGNLIRTFLEEGSALVELLRQDLATFGARETLDAETGALREFIETLLASAGAPVDAGPGIAADNQPLEPLTERENAILRLLASGVSNKEIARHIFVSENTVKFHLKNIYSKLGVSSRVQAIGAARQMGLI